MASGGAPELQQYVAPKLSKTFQKFVGQKKEFPGIQDVVKESAKLALQAREELFPGYMGTLGQAWQIAKERGEGLVSPEIAKRVSEMAAQYGFSTGTGPGSEQMGLQAAKQYGLTAQQLQDSGMQIGQALRAEAVGTMPLQALNLAFTPAQIRSEDVQIGMYNNQIANQQAMLDAQYGGSPFGGILGGVLGTGAGFAIGNMVAPGFGGLIGAGLGAQLGGGVGGAFGGAQGRQFGGIFSGLGGSLAGLGAMGQFGGGFGGLMGLGGGGGFSSLGAAQAAAPFAASYTPYMGGFVPRAQPVTP